MYVFEANDDGAGPEGGTVLDPFNGSGTTGQVALQRNRNYIGIELNPEYVELSHNRLSKVTQKPSLFTPQPEQWQRQELLAAD